MEGWLYGLFTLLGVLVGGLFTYLGLRRQLYLQKEINTMEWRRKVRSEPLLKLRDELAQIAAISNRLMYAWEQYHKLIGTTEEQKAKEKLQKATNDFNSYSENGTRQNAMFLQFDKEVVTKILEIVDIYNKSINASVQGEELTAGKILNIIVEAQELINKQLEKLS